MAGGICKLVIKAYSDSSFGSEKGEFVSTINPSDLHTSSGINYSTSQLMGNANFGLKYNTHTPRELSFKLIFDNSGVFVDNKATVKEQIESLQSILLNYQDDLNEPYYVRVIWGTVDFKGKLSKFDTSYTMFQMDGTPIRAEAEITVIEHAVPTGKAKSLKEQKSSSDKKDGKSDGNSNTKAAVVNQNDNKQTQKQAENKAKANDSSSQSTEDRSDAAKTKDSYEQDKNGAPDNKKNTTDDKKAATDDKKKDKGNDVKQNNENDADVEGNRNTQKGKEAKSQTSKINDKTSVPGSTVKNLPSSISTNSLDKVKNKITTAGQSLANLVKDNSLLGLIGKFNALDALRGLVAGVVLGIPLLLAGLLAFLIAKLIKLAKRGVSYIKKKAKSASSSAKSKAKNAKDKTKAVGNSAKEKTKSLGNGVKEKGKAIASKTKSKASSTGNSAKSTGSKVSSGAKNLFNKARGKS